MGPCAPCVITADAHLPESHTDHRIVHLRQFIGMGSVLDLMGCPGQNVDGEVLSEEGHAPASAVGQVQPAHAAVVAALLRNQVAGKIFFDGLFVDAESGALLPVSIRDPSSLYIVF